MPMLPTLDVLAWWLLKGSAIVLLAALLTRLLASRPAALRHAVWCVAVAAQLLLPFGERLLPERAAEALGLAVPLPPAVVTTAAGAPAPRQPVAIAAGSTVRPGERHARPAVTWRTAWPWLLASGTLFVLLRLAAGTARITAIARGSRRVTDGDWLSLLQTQCRTLGVHRPVTLIRSDRIRLPVTWGFVYPTVLLPASADSWSPECRRHVLLHELAHVRRLDALTQVLGHLALALFWFNPLVWLALARMRAEAENACDDHVLRGGERPSAYASTLLDLVRAYDGRTAPAFASLSVVRRSELERRVTAITRPGRDASARGGLVALAAGVTLALALPLSAARLAARDGVGSGKDALEAISGQRAATERGVDCRPLIVPGADFSQTSGTLTLDDGRTMHYFFLRPASERCIEASFPLDARFTDDDRDLAPTPGLQALLREKLPGIERTVRLSERGGELRRVYLRDGRPASWDDEAERWYRRILAEFIGRTAAGAAARTRRIVERGGVEALYAELPRLELEVRRQYLLALAGLRPAAELSRAELIAAAREALSAHPSTHAGFLADLAEREGGAADVRDELLLAAAELGNPADRGTVLAALLRHHDRDSRRAALAAAGELLPSSSWLRYFLLEAQPFALGADPSLHDAYFAAVERLEKPAEKRELLLELLARDLPPEATARVVEAARRLPDERLRAELAVRGFL